MHSGIHWPGGVCLVRVMMIFVGKQRCAVKLSVVSVSAVLSFWSQNRSAIF